MKMEGRRSSRLHLELDLVTKMCKCGCGLSMKKLLERMTQLRFLHESEAKSVALKRLLEKNRVVFDSGSVMQWTMSECNQRSSFSGKLVKRDLGDE